MRSVYALQKVVVFVVIGKQSGLVNGRWWRFAMEGRNSGEREASVVPITYGKNVSVFVHAVFGPLRL